MRADCRSSRGLRPSCPGVARHRATEGLAAPRRAGAGVAAAHGGLLSHVRRRYGRSLPRAATLATTTGGILVRVGDGPELAGAAGVLGQGAVDLGRVEVRPVGR